MTGSTLPRPRAPGPPTGGRGGTLPPVRLLLDGRAEAPVSPRRIAFGGFELSVDGADLRRLRWGGSDLLDSVYVSVRDRDWDTIPAEVSRLRVRRPRGGPLTVAFVARNRSRDIDLAWRGRITVADGGPIVYSMEGEAGAGFLYCRIGFCILHAAAIVAGRPYVAETPGGEVRGLLPQLVAPQEIVEGREVPLVPACSGLSVDLGGVTVRTAFTGSLFEMEDQRNWTDASFKTCCVVGTPYPYQARRGQRFAQRVTIHASGSPARRQVRAPRIRSIELERGEGPFWPALGLGMSTQLARPLTGREGSRVKSLRLDHLRVDLHLSNPEWQRVLARATADAAAAGAGLEVALLGDEARTQELCDLGADLDAGRVVRVIVLHEPTARNRTTPLDYFQLARGSFGRLPPSILLFGGTDGDFAELNRDRPSHDAFDGLSYAMNPQVHAFDDDSLVETLAAQATTVETARSFSRGRPVIVSPVTLRQRFNPAATGEPSPVQEGSLPSSVDARQASLFTAGWTLGSIASLAGAGAASATYFETVGWRGVMETTRGPLPNGRFPSRPGMVFPVFHVLADLAGRHGTDRLDGVSAAPGQLALLGLADGAKTRALVANLTHGPVEVAVGPLPGKVASVRILDERTLTDAVFVPSRYRRVSDHAPLRNGVLRATLRPFGYLRVDARGH